MGQGGFLIQNLDPDPKMEPAAFVKDIVEKAANAVVS